MYWLYLLLALGCFAFALKTPSAALTPTNGLVIIA